MMTQDWQEINSLIPELFQWISSGPQKTLALARSQGRHRRDWL